eukprot:CAMPEP_0171160600 /NCGR_PEP_ID=MMETSP0790-20130122/3639_1 /TAXON_ID=2925 /ORGANISM="Alexandrium catenella, Strain OF101" /LENGTH=197 /DNA_ID=CAMNT_0011625135 /DNA_START=120 /DNA_END=709 /DNA_ORIENTATION=+
MDHPYDWQAALPQTRALNLASGVAVELEGNIYEAWVDCLQKALLRPAPCVWHRVLAEQSEEALVLPPAGPQERHPHVEAALEAAVHKVPDPRQVLVLPKRGVEDGVDRTARHRVRVHVEDAAVGVEAPERQLAELVREPGKSLVHGQDGGHALEAPAHRLEAVLRPVGQPHALADEEELVDRQRQVLQQGSTQRHRP